MLYQQLCNFLSKLNGDVFSPDMVDRTLERGEALRDIKRKHPILSFTELIQGNGKKITEPYSDSEILTIVNSTRAEDQSNLT